MCKHCEDKKSIAKFIDKNILYVNEGELNVTTEDGRITYSADINYCPMCGRKLGDE